MGESMPAVGLSDCFYFFGDMLSGILPIILAVFQMQFITLRLNLLQLMLTHFYLCYKMLFCGDMRIYFIYSSEQPAKNIVIIYQIKLDTDYYAGIFQRLNWLYPHLWAGRQINAFLRLKFFLPYFYIYRASAIA